MSDKNSPLINLPELPDSIDNAVKNLTDKPTQRIGQTLSDIWYLVFGGLSHAADKRRMKYSHDLELYKQELSQTIKAIPDEALTEPSIQITAQALENSKYCIESENLRKMFVNLISKSMDNRYISNVHPSFAEIIKQMDPVDARILKELYPISSFPVADYIIKCGHKTYRALLTNACIIPNLAIDIERVSASISSLNRLGIVNFNRQARIENSELYHPFTENVYYQQLSAEIKSSNSSEDIDIKKYLGFFTPLGKNFCEVCLE